MVIKTNMSHCRGGGRVAHPAGGMAHALNPSNKEAEPDKSP